MANIIEQIVRITTDGEETRAEVIGELVRCKDCKYYDHRHHYCEGIGNWFGFEDEWSDNGFCYKGERKETEDGH